MRFNSGFKVLMYVRE